MTRVRNAEFRKDGTIIHYVACWNCLLDMCPGGPHDWADQDDVDHARSTGQPDPTGQPCRCACVDGPLLDEEPEPNESLDLEPCPVCGSEAECAYDADGRPLIHALPEEDDE